MNDYIPLSTLNDFIFCPYSIYLHSVYMESDEDLYKATPQIKGAIRLQFSVYEVRNTKRIVNNLMSKIEAYAKHFTADDSVILFDIEAEKLTKYGNAIRRDQDVVYF